MAKQNTKSTFDGEGKWKTSGTTFTVQMTGRKQATKLLGSWNRKRRSRRRSRRRNGRGRRRAARVCEPRLRGRRGGGDRPGVRADEDAEGGLGGKVVTGEALAGLPEEEDDEEEIIAADEAAERGG